MCHFKKIESVKELAVILQGGGSTLAGEFVK